VAYLHPVRARRNLVVRTEAMVSRITFDKGRANGVTCVVRGVAHHYEATGEVLLAGGAINSPQLLMLSGICPAH
jgi:choline dehydrogenase